MNSKFDSFFIKQKQIKSVTKPRNTVLYGVNPTLNPYYFVENVINNRTDSFVHNKDNIYYIFYKYSSIINLSSSSYSIKFDQVKLDIFPYYLGLQMIFKACYTCKSRPNELTFFYLYNKAFVNNFTLLRSVVFINKYVRFSYKHNLQSIRQGTFITNGTKNAVIIFNNLFLNNNHNSFTQKKYFKKLFTQKLRSTKILRDVSFNRKSSKRFKSRQQAKLFFKTYKAIYSKFNKAFTNTVSSFPKNLWYRNQVVKVVKRAKKTKTVSKVVQSSVFYTKKFPSYSKSLIPTAVNFKLYPTEYGESSLNPSRRTQFKSLASFRLNSQLSFYQINAFSLTRFVFDSGITKLFGDHSKNKNKQSKYYLANVEREILSRYRSTGVYIKDLIRICFFSRFLKKADFLASFFAFTISKLSPNRKGLPFVRFLIKLLKMFAFQNSDILGIRIRFQGRLNRWRRTKAITGSMGKLTFSSYDTRVEYGIGQAITRKGALGVQIWIVYKLSASSKLSESIITYRGLSKIEVIPKLNFLISNY